MGQNERRRITLKKPEWIRAIKDIMHYYGGEEWQYEDTPMPVLRLIHKAIPTSKRSGRVPD